MASEKVTIMILNVDLNCPSCYKKVKKLLYRFPQIRDQVFDEDKNRVMIKVVRCDPERIRDKLFCKGGKSIQSIEIIENKPKPQEPEKKPKPEVKPPPDPVEKPKVDPPKKLEPAPPQFPSSMCYHECHEGCRREPFYYGYERPVPPVLPPPGRQYYDGYGYQYARPCYVSGCDCYSDKNQQGCSIM